MKSNPSLWEDSHYSLPLKTITQIFLYQIFFQIFVTIFEHVESFWVISDSERTYIRKNRYLFHYNTGTFRKTKLPITICSITQTDNHAGIKSCSWNEWSHSNIQQKDFFTLSFQLLPSIFGIDNSTKWVYFTLACLVNYLPRYLQIHLIIHAIQHYLT